MNKHQLLWAFFSVWVTSVSAQRVVITFNAPLTNTPSVSKASLRYDKDFAYSLTFDDGGLDGFTCALPALEGGFSQCSGTTLSALQFTDGCGNTIPFKAGLAWNAANAIGQDAHDGRIADKMTWAQLDNVYDKGWDVFNHSFSHKSRSTHTLTTQDYINEIKDNNADVRNKTRNKIEMPLFVVPSGDGNYQSIAYEQGHQLVFDQSANTIGFGGLSVKTNFTPNGQVLHRQLLEDALNSGKDNIGIAASKSINGEKIWYNEFTHHINGTSGLTFDRFRTHLERISNTWGKSGSDRIWMATLQEVYEYLNVREKVTYTATVSGNQLILDFNLSQLPSWLRRKPLTLVVDGGNFSQVDVPQGVKMSFNGAAAKKIINMDFAGASTVINPCDTDTENPVFSNCPQNINLSTTGTIAIANWTAPTATDNCTTNPSVTSNFNSGATFPVGSTTVTYTAKDSKNNTAICSFNIIVTKTTVTDVPSCVSKSEAPWNEWLAEVQLGSFSNTSSKNLETTNIVGYSDFKNKIISVKRNTVYPLSITPGLSWTGYQPDLYCRVWLDFNGNKTFESSEKIFEKANFREIVKDSTYIPLSAIIGNVTMRVSLKKGGFPTACETFANGEVEDYTINIANEIINPNPCDTDKIVPVITNCPQNIVLITTATTAQATWATITATDNCGVPSVSGSHQPNQDFPLGTTSVLYIAEDAKANKASCNFSVTVNTFKDTVKKADISLSINASSKTYRQWTVDTFFITAKNIGNTAASAVKIEFKFPFKTASGGTVTPSLGTWREFCPGSVRCFEWDMPSLAPNQTATLTAPLFVLDAIEPIIASSRLLASTPADTVGINNQASITIQLAPTVRKIIQSEEIDKATIYVPVVVQDIMPNPTEGIFSISIKSIVTQDIQLFFYNTLGQIVKLEIRKVEKGDNLLQVDLSNQKDGIYFIKTSVGGGQSIPVKFVKM